MTLIAYRRRTVNTFAFQNFGIQNQLGHCNPFTNISSGLNLGLSAGLVPNLGFGGLAAGASLPVGGGLVTGNGVHYGNGIHLGNGNAYAGIGDAGNNLLGSTGNGNALYFNGGPGNDHIRIRGFGNAVYADGGSGLDTLNLGGRAQDWAVNKLADNSTLLTNRWNGNRILSRNIEQFRTHDGTFADPSAVGQFGGHCGVPSFGGGINIGVPHCHTPAVQPINIAYAGAYSATSYAAAGLQAPAVNYAAPVAAAPAYTAPVAAPAYTAPVAQTGYAGSVY